MSIDLFAIDHQQTELQSELETACARVLASGRFILGPEVEAFERELADFVGVEHAIGVSSGTDALVCALGALECGPGSEVVLPAFSFFATAGAVRRVGATPRLADIELDSLGLDPAAAEAALGPLTRALLPVQLYGHPGRLAELSQLAEARSLALVEDAAQAFGASLHGRRVGSWGTLGCFSFFPTKPLGGFGDGGMVVTQRADLAARCRRLRGHGASGKHEHQEVGGNYRLDALQAALLRVKLSQVERWRALRAAVARRYRKALADLDGLVLPGEPEQGESAHALFTLRVLDRRRDALAAHLAEQGVSSAVYYPRPLHEQPALADLGYRRGQFPNAELASQQVLSLPMSAGLSSADVDRVVEAIRGYFR